MTAIADAPKIKALAPWFGSKRNLAPEIVAELGLHRAYWEPFCGSMAITLVKPQCSMETVNDLNGDLINLARTIQHPTEGPRLYRRLRRVWMSSELFVESATVIKSAAFESTPDRAFHYFVFCWMGRNGDSGTTKVGYGFCKRFTKNGGHAATRFAGVVDSVPAFRRRLRNVTILSECGLGLLERIEDADGTVIYCDPPYIVKGAKYFHDFAADDHRRG
ncbi:MAG: DNA adenine methylase [Planctomycetaceae bacterium]